MKIFGIGLSKTGTSSLAHALEILGYKTRDYPGLERYAPGDLSCIDTRLLEEHDALTDTPIPSFYRELDARYPGSKFILTVRDMGGWLKSCQKQFNQKHADKQNEAHNQLFMDLYGCTAFDEALFRAGYERFVQGVQDYFKNRPGDLLTLDVAAGEGWEKLCPFLGKPIPDQPFPKANVTQIRWMDINALVRLVREAGEEILRVHCAMQPDSQRLAWHERIAALPRRAVYAINGGRPYALRAATDAADSLLARGLSRLNPDIPVISRIAHAVPHGERSKWNHFWLVDPLDGEAGFAADAGEFTVNLALIEDQKPIAGVIYAPLSGAVYYAMVGKGVYKTDGHGPPMRLDARDDESDAQLPTRAPDTRLLTPTPASKALALCQWVEEGTGAAPEIVDTMEWHSAAAHAMARLTGRRILVCQGGQELSYNKADWTNPCLRVE
jgi:3'-phosphoadenosine 5'-phosphosulfate (PAPS) 3'-phosphatase